MAAKPRKRGATYDDLHEVPDNFVAEIFDGDLYATPRPALPHTHASTALGAKLFEPFHRTGPGGWVILDEPELHFGRDVVVPDLAGWRRERLPSVPPEPFLALAPDWVCEVLSSSTEAVDRGPKLRIFAREHVPHCWLVDPARQSLEVLVLESGQWALRERHEARVKVRAAPFDAIELELGALWI